MRRLSFLMLLAIFLICVSQVCAEPVKIDSFDRTSNLLGGKASTYAKAPSRTLALQTDSEFYGDAGKSLLLKYDKKGEGGPYGNGGWCGYYTLLKSGQEYFDATGKKNLSFYIKGAKGGEEFMIGIADKEWDELGDSVKSKKISSYLPEGAVTTEWQKATVPLSEFALAKHELASIALCFETACFEGGAGRGTLYIDEMMLE